MIRNALSWARQFRIGRVRYPGGLQACSIETPWCLVELVIVSYGDTGRSKGQVA